MHLGTVDLLFIRVKIHVLLTTLLLIHKMRLSPRHICIFILGISIVLKSNEVPIQRSEISTTQDENKYLTASYIPPFLRNLYHTISQSAQSSRTPLQIFKGSFEGKKVFLRFITILLAFNFASLEKLNTKNNLKSEYLDAN